MKELLNNYFSESIFCVFKLKFVTSFVNLSQDSSVYTTKLWTSVRW